MRHRFLRYHVVKGAIAVDNLEDGQELTTVDGHVITVEKAPNGRATLVDRDGGFATFERLQHDLVATNGMVHVISYPLFFRSTADRPSDGAGAARPALFAALLLVFLV